MWITVWCVFLSQGVIPLGGCVVSANEDMGMPFAIVINLEDFTVRTQNRRISTAKILFIICLMFDRPTWN